MYQALLCLSMMTPAQPPADYGCPPKTVCVKEPTVVKVPHTVYGTKCIEYCLPHRSLCKTLLCQGDDALCCSPVHVRHVLVKKTTTCEKCEMKCELKEVAPCDTCHSCAPAHSGIMHKK